MKQGFLCLAALILPLSVAAAEDFSGIPDEALKAEINRVVAEIDALTSDLSCDENEQCRYIKYGHKPCGGPAGYRIYSSKNTDVAAIDAHADELFRLTEEYNKRLGLMSNCAVEMPPALRCETVCKRR